MTIDQYAQVLIDNNLLMFDKKQGYNKSEFLAICGSIADVNSQISMHPELVFYQEVKRVLIKRHEQYCYDHITEIRQMKSLNF